MKRYNSVFTCDGVSIYPQDALKEANQEMNTWIDEMEKEWDNVDVGTLSISSMHITVNNEIKCFVCLAVAVRYWNN